MKTLQDWANEIAEAHWTRKREPLEIIKGEIVAKRKGAEFPVADMKPYSKKALDALKSSLLRESHPLDHLFFPPPNSEAKPMVFYSYGLDPITRELIPLVFYNKKDWLTHKACEIYEYVVRRELGPLDRFDFVAKRFKAYSEDFDFIMNFISAREFEKNQKLRGDTNG